MEENYRLIYKGLILITVILFVAASIIPPTKAENIGLETLRVTIYVDNNASCPGNGTLVSPYCMIQYALDNANKNDIIKVANGTYYENIIISTEGVNLEWYGTDILGQDIGQPVIDGGKLSDVVKIFAKNVEISQFTIQNSGDLNFGVNILASEVTLSNCDIIDNYNGVQLPRPDSNLCTIEGCTIHNSVLSGILLFDQCKDNEITNCQITGNRWGIWVVESFDHVIQENFFQGNNIGLVLQGANTFNVDVFRCVFKKNQIGVWLYGGANRNFIHYCDFIDNVKKYGPLSFLTGFSGTKGAWRMHAIFSLCVKQSWDHNYWSPRPRFQNTTQPYIIWGTMYPSWIATVLPGAWRPQIPWINVDKNCRSSPLS